VRAQSDALGDVGLLAELRSHVTVAMQVGPIQVGLHSPLLP